MLNLFLAENVGFFAKIFADFHKVFIEKARYLIYLEGLINTLIIALGACILGIVIGAAIVLVRIAPKNHLVVKVLDKIAALYVTVIRGTPVVLQLLIMYFVVLKSVSFYGNGVPVAILTFGINSGAYMSEILRAGIIAIDKGQLEASRSLGFNWWQSMKFVILPQGIKNALPTMFNEFIMLVKETSVAGYVAIIDLTKSAQIVISQAVIVFPPYIIVALIYLSVVLGLQFLQKKLERRLRRGD